MTTARSQLAALARDHGDDIPVARGAALIAAMEHPGQSAEVALDQLQALADRVSLNDEMPIFEVAARLNSLLFNELGFAGDRDDYDDPENSCLDSVLLRRRGLPILLSIVYVEVARRAGRLVHPIGFPGHFLVSPDGGEPPFYVDPFNQGSILRQETLLAQLASDYGVRTDDAIRLLEPLQGRLVLYRVCGNLKNSWLRRGDAAGALRAIEGMLLFAPERVDQHRDRGLLLQQLGRVGEAISALERYLLACPGAADATDVAAHVDRLKRTEA